MTSVNLLRSVLIIFGALSFNTCLGQQDDRHQGLAELFASLSNPVQSATRVSASVQSFDADQIYSVIMNNQINTRWSINGEIDTTGYVSLGGGYGRNIKRWYGEVFFNYGRADIFDTLDSGIFLVRPIGEKNSLYFSTSYNWRENALLKELYYQEEWQNSVGVSHAFTKRFTVTISAHYSRLLKDIRLGDVGEKEAVTAQDIRLSYDIAMLEVYVQYFTGEYRVSAGAEVTRDDSIAFGIGSSF